MNLESDLLRIAALHTSNHGISGHLSKIGIGDEHNPIHLDTEYWVYHRLLYQRIRVMTDTAILATSPHFLRGVL